MGHPNWTVLARHGQLPDWKKKELGLSGDVNPEAIPVVEEVKKQEKSKKGIYPINKLKKSKK